MADVPNPDGHEEAKNTLIERRDWRSEHVTNMARNLAFGVLALVWGVLALGDASEISLNAWQEKLLLASGLGAVVTLLLDWLQAINGYIIVDQSLKRVIAEKLDRPVYRKDATYHLNSGLFWTKQIVSPLSAAGLLIALASAML